MVAGWADRGTAPAARALDSAWPVVEDQAAEELRAVEPEAVVRLEAGRLAIPACGNLVAREAVELAGARAQVAEAEPEQAVVEQSVAVERQEERKAPRLENG